MALGAPLGDPVGAALGAAHAAPPQHRAAAAVAAAAGTHAAPRASSAHSPALSHGGFRGRGGNDGGSACPATVQYIAVRLAAANNPHGARVHTRARSYPHPVPAVSRGSASGAHRPMPAPAHHASASACVTRPLHPGSSGAARYSRVAPHADPPSPRRTIPMDASTASAAHPRHAPALASISVARASCPKAQHTDTDNNNNNKKTKTKRAIVGGHRRRVPPGYSDSGRARHGGAS